MGNSNTMYRILFFLFVSLTAIAQVPKTIEVRNNCINQCNNCTDAPAGTVFEIRDTYPASATYVWDFGDGSFSTSTEPYHIYPNPGRYIVKLNSTTLSNGCSVLDSIEVESLIQPSATAVSDTNLGCKPLNVNFNNLSQNADFYTWNFGNNNYSSVFIPSHTYMNSGIFNGSLIAFNLNGCKDTSFFNINVNPKPDANFNFFNIDTCVLPISYSFQNTSSINCDYLWDFGDSSSSTFSSPNNTYSTNGQYLVSLYIDNIYGCRDTNQQLINIDTVPFSSFVLDTSSGCIPLAVNFSNNSTNSNFYNWYFGDGNFSSQNSPTYSYFNPGNYQIKLITQDLNGCEDSSFKNIIIYPEPTSDFTINSTNPCFQPVLTSYNNNSLGANYFIWDFGNGLTSNLTSPSLNFDSIANYNISLIAGNSYGCEDTMVQAFNVYQQPSANFSTILDTICLRDSILLVSQSLYEDSIIWNLNGFSFGASNDTSILITSPGFYNLELYALNNNGFCVDTAVLNSGIQVLPSPVADFSVSPVNGCIPLLNVNFVNLSLSADNYIWDFGDYQKLKGAYEIEKKVGNELILNKDSSKKIVAIAVKEYFTKVCKVIKTDQFITRLIH